MIRRIAFFAPSTTVFLTKRLVFLCVVLAVVASDISFSGQDSVPSVSPFEMGAATHETRVDPQAALQFPKTSQTPAGIEPVLSTPPTRTSFMASWDKVAGATGYLLDVSTSESFTSYVDGYHNLDVGNVTGRIVTGLNPGTTYYYRIHSYTTAGPGSYSEATRATTVPTTGLIIHATFDNSITGNPNAAAIEAMINRAISIYESLFGDPITIQIRFRYATTAPNGTPLAAGQISRSDFVVYTVPWDTAVNFLMADSSTTNDNIAIASLPESALSPNVKPSSANGRAVGGDTPPAMFANGTVGTGGPYDGIVTLNSATPYRFSRPPGAGNFDAQRLTEHEIDEVIGLGSRLGHGGNDVRPQDVFSWSSPGHRNITSSGTRYFSIDVGVTNIVNFNQNPSGDFGDWLSTACPQAHPYVQNAFTCTGQSSDVSATSPEGINLDVIGYDLEGTPIAAPYDFNNDTHSDYLLSNSGTRQTAIWYLNNNVRIGTASGPTVPGGWQVAAVADFNHDAHPDYLLFNPATRATVIWYMNDNFRIGSTYGPTLPGGWSVGALADFNGDGYPDYLLYNATTGGTVVWYMRNNVHIGSASGPALPGGWTLAGVADFNGDNRPDYLLFNAGTHGNVIWYMSGVTRVGSHAGPTVTASYNVVGLSDFDHNGRPDYVLYASGTGQTAIWYLNNYQLIGTASGPTLPAGWTLAAP